MRERVVVWMVRCGLLLLVASACGDDDGGGGDAGSPDSGPAPGGSGGTMSGGTGGTTGMPPIVPLGDNVAGKPCTNTTDCDGAMCVTSFASVPLLPATPAPGGYCTGECETNAHCGAGGVCVGALMGLTRGQCFASCTMESDCRAEYFCTTSTSLLGVTIPSNCQPKPRTDQLEDGVAGDMCMVAADCPGGVCQLMTPSLIGMGAPLPGGYCSGACLEDGHCGEGGVCALAPIEGIAGSCYQSCATDVDCTRDGYRCRPQSGDVRGCDAFPDPLPDDVVGDVCSADADCGGGAGTCRTALPVAGFGAVLGMTTPAPGGYCTQDCTAGEDDCGAGGVCVGSALGGGTCFAMCTTAMDCRDGYLCEQRGGGGAAPAAGDAGPAPVGDAGAPMGMTVCVPIPMAPDMDAGGG